jgi:TRAP-type C4-dicarboxylate transport system permease small subunit
MNRLLAVNIDSVSTGNGKTFSNTYTSLGSITNSFLKTSLTVAGIIFLCLLIFGGFNLIIGAGDNDPKKAAQSQAIVTNAIIGFLVVILAYFIIQVIETVTGLKILNPGLE